MNHQRQYPNTINSGIEDPSHFILIRRLEACHCYYLLLAGDEQGLTWPWESLLNSPGHGQEDATSNAMAASAQPTAVIVPGNANCRMKQGEDLEDIFGFAWLQSKNQGFKSQVSTLVSDEELLDAEKQVENISEDRLKGKSSAEDNQSIAGGKEYAGTDEMKHSYDRVVGELESSNARIYDLEQLVAKLQRENESMKRNSEGNQW